MSPYHRDLRSAADQEFFARKRKLSPQYPNLDELDDRRRNKQEAFAARLLLALTALFGIATPFADKPLWMGAATGACVVGFVITCIVAGNRAHNKAGGNSGKPGA